MLHWFNISLAYLLIWWLVFFAVLPFGAKLPSQVEKGHSAGAPAHHHIALKALVTTILASILTWVFVLILQSDLVQIRNAIP